MPQHIHFRLFGSDHIQHIAVQKGATTQAVERALAGKLQLPPGTFDIYDSKSLAPVSFRELLDSAAAASGPMRQVWLVKSRIFDPAIGGTVAYHPHIVPLHTSPPPPPSRILHAASGGRAFAFATLDGETDDAGGNFRTADTLSASANARKLVRPPHADFEREWDLAYRSDGLRGPRPSSPLRHADEADRGRARQSSPPPRSRSYELAEEHGRRLGEESRRPWAAVGPAWTWADGEGRAEAWSDARQHAERR